METIIVALVSALVAGSAGFWLGKRKRIVVEKEIAKPVVIPPNLRSVTGRRYAVLVDGEAVFAGDDEEEVRQKRRELRQDGQQATITTNGVN